MINSTCFLSPPPIAERLIRIFDLGSFRIFFCDALLITAKMDMTLLLEFFAKASPSPRLPSYPSWTAPEPYDYVAIDKGHDDRVPVRLHSTLRL